MCLHVRDDQKFKVTDKPVVCYKVYDLRNPRMSYKRLSKLAKLKRKFLGRFNIYSPFQGNEYYWKGQPIDLPKVNAKEKFTGRIVNEGYHTIAYEYEIQTLLGEMHYTTRSKKTRDLVVFECIIPPGAEIITGRWSGYKGYTSSELIINKHLKQYK